jgi:hypothetical protein
MDHMKAEMSVLLDFRGVRVRRVLDPSRAVVAEHAHDWPMISLYVMGGYQAIATSRVRRALNRLRSSSIPHGSERQRYRRRRS